MRSSAAGVVMRVLFTSKANNSLIYNDFLEVAGVPMRGAAGVVMRG